MSPDKDRWTPQGIVEGIGDPQAQVGQELANIQALVEAASGSLAVSVDLTAYLRNMSYRSIITEVRKALLRASFPTATMFVTTEWPSTSGWRRSAPWLPSRPSRPSGLKISPEFKVLHDRSFEEVVDRVVGEISQVTPSAAVALR